MICKYATRPEIPNNNRHYLTCNITDNQCLMIRFCSRVNDIVNIDDVDKKCKIYIDKEDVEYMEQGKYKVICESKGLWIELNKDTAIVIPNPFEGEIPIGVDLIKINDEYFIKGFEPKTKELINEKMFSDVVELKVEPKKNYNKRDAQK